MNNILKNIESFFFEIGWDSGHLIILNVLIDGIGYFLIVLGVLYLRYFLFTKDGKAQAKKDKLINENDKFFFIKLIGLLFLFIIIGLILIKIEL